MQPDRVRHRQGTDRRTAAADRYPPSARRIPTPTTLSGPIASIIARNSSARELSNRRRNQPCPSATTRVVVMRGGGSPNNLRNNAWWVSELSAKAISAEVST